MTESAARRKPRLLIRALIYLVVIYLVWCGVVFAFQHKLMFPAGLVGPAGEPWRADTIEMTREIGDGRQVTAWLFLPPGTSADHPAPLVAYCYGNAEQMSMQQHVVEGYDAMGVAVLIVDYRGYGHSDGSPNQRTLTDDLVRFIDAATKRPQIDGDRIAIHGRSIGGAVAAQAAKQRPPDALILESTFTHTGSFAWRYGVPPLLMRSPFKTRDVLPTLGKPVLLFHGEADRIIPPSHSRKLHELTPDSVLVTYPDVGHNDFPGIVNEQAYWRRVHAFLKDAGVVGTPTPRAQSSPSTAGS